MVLRVSQLLLLLLLLLLLQYLLKGPALLQQVANLGRRLPLDHWLSIGTDRYIRHNATHLHLTQSCDDLCCRATGHRERRDRHCHRCCGCVHWSVLIRLLRFRPHVGVRLPGHGRLTRLRHQHLQLLYILTDLEALRLDAVLVILPHQ